ncbi:MAG: carboxypeptidase M32, partial [Caldilineaceae bacterium]|nr:carboxypeptidase M32 [Caldilineaceae bacterium]
MTGTFEQKRAELVARLREYYDIHGAIALLSWDQTTYMPPKGAPARARQLATLQRIAHEKRTDPEIGRLLDALQPYTEQLPPNHDDAALVRVTRRQYEQAIKVPADFAAEFAAHTAEAYAAWTTARPADDFAAVKPYLQKTLEMSRTMADFFPGYQHIADPLIDLADFGMRADTIRPLFEELRQALAPLVKAIADRPQVDDSFLRCHYPATTQWAFGEAV